MDPYLMKGIGFSVALFGGFVTKRVSKKRDSIVHKALSPLAAVASGFGAALAMGEGEVSFSTALGTGLEFGMAAVFGQSMFRGVKAQMTGKI